MSLDDIPQMDGTCDACEPDEAQVATQVCHNCSFAFCSLHADEHASSTHHSLAPYDQEGMHANGRTTDAYSGFGSGTKEPPPPLEGVPNEQDGDLRHETGDMNGHKSKKALLLQGADLGADLRGEGSEGLPVDKAVTEAVKDSVSVDRLRCMEHGQEGSLYCKPDEKIICVVCAMQGEHQGHEIITLHDAYIWQKDLIFVTFGLSCQGSPQRVTCMSRHLCDLLDSIQQMEEKISKKWTNSEMSTVELEAYVSSQFDALRRLLFLEEKKALHILDLKEAFLTASAAEKIAEINVQTERLQEEMASITHQLCLLDKATISPALAAEALVEASGPGHRLTDFEARPRLPVPRADPVDLQEFDDSGSGRSMDHAP
ncbi:tripartite motif-containing protein 44 isoform X2 [Hippocampus comes]|uniref:tripartite motif-containing protein 44 isoform X2 n=1 Tax=Hippocampus comes TaxID=109280 RepID=UPI00094F0FD5|nr:PREDICTED: tripartite motif-containing protein 44 isoform X2 [Hippocampus comes]